MTHMAADAYYNFFLLRFSQDSKRFQVISVSWNFLPETGILGAHFYDRTTYDSQQLVMVAYGHCVDNS